MLRFAWAQTLLMIAILAPVSAIAVADGASAHVPSFELGGHSYDDAVLIEPLSTSYAFYGDLAYMERGDPDGARYFVFDGEQGESFSFMVGTEPETQVFPGVLLIGAGLPGLEGEAEAIMSSTGLQLPDGWGAMGWARFPDGIVPPYIDIWRTTQFEPFTQTPYVGAGSGNYTLPVAGTYYVVLTGPVMTELSEPRSVTVFLVTGYEEDFGIEDFVLISWYWLRVQYLWGGLDEMYYLAPMVVVVSFGLTLDIGMRRRSWSTDQWSKRRLATYYTGVTGSLLMVGVGANQVALLVLYSSYHGWEGIVLLVLAMQVACIVIGLVALRFVRNQRQDAQLREVSVFVLVAAASVLLGAGVIVGPALFVLGVVAHWGLRGCSGGRLTRV